MKGKEQELERTQYSNCFKIKSNKRHHQRYEKQFLRHDNKYKKRIKQHWYVKARIRKCYKWKVMSLNLLLTENVNAPHVSSQISLEFHR